jgi:aminoglycoside phosphotransferase (APT) family kinase protein
MIMDIDDYLRSMGVEAQRAEKIAHDDTISATIYKIILKDKTQLVLKICADPNRYRRETYFLDRLKNLLPVPRITHRNQAKRAILMEYIDGAPLSAHLSNDLAHQMGALLAHLHQIPADKYGDLSKIGSPNSDPIQEMQSYFQESLGECRPVLDPSLLERAEQYFEDHLPDPESLDGPCIVHRDYKPGNIMADQNRIRAIIDWENARGSFAEEDFAQMDHLAWSQNARSKKPFLKGYESIRPLPAWEQVLPFLRLCKALGAIGFTIRRQTWQGIHRSIYEKNLRILKELIDKA